MASKVAKVQLLDLPTELLLHILNFCTLTELNRLKQTCSRLNSIIGIDAYRHQSLSCIVTNQKTKSIKERSYMILDPYEKCRISHNWIIGRYTERTYFNNSEKHMPWLVLTKSHIWFSRGNSTKAYKRTSNMAKKCKPEYTFGTQHNSDVCKFSVKGPTYFSGHRDGSLMLGSTLHDKKRYIRNAHYSDVHAVEFNDKYFVSGSKDGMLFIWKLNEEEFTLSTFKTFRLLDVIWSCDISPQGDLFSVGFAGNHRGSYPIGVYDVQTEKMAVQFHGPFRRGAGLLDMHWLNPHVILTCGYDAFVKKWDVRSGKIVGEWEDPHDSALYCLSTDDCYTVVCGTQSYGRVVLWDMRTKNYKQMYFLGTAKYRSSPVYGVAFDACDLYAATDKCLNVLNFSGRMGYIKNYSDMYSHHFS